MTFKGSTIHSNRTIDLMTHTSCRFFKIISIPSVAHNVQTIPKGKEESPRCKQSTRNLSDHAPLNRFFRFGCSKLHAEGVLYSADWYQSQCLDNSIGVRVLRSPSYQCLVSPIFHSAFYPLSSKLCIAKVNGSPKPVHDCQNNLPFKSFIHPFMLMLKLIACQFQPQPVSSLRKPSALLSVNPRNNNPCYPPTILLPILPIFLRAPFFISPTAMNQ